MAKSKGAKEAAAAVVEPVKAAKKAAADKDFTVYADKAPTDLQVRFAAWLKEKVGLTFGTKKEEAAFDNGIRLGVFLRIPFQESPENQAVLEQHRAEAAAKAAAPKAEKAAKAPAKGAKTKAAVDEAKAALNHVAEVAAEEAPVEAEAAPAEAAPAPKAKAAPKRQPAKKAGAKTTAKAPF